MSQDIKLENLWAKGSDTIYSGVNNYARVAKDKTLKITLDEAKEFLYELDFDERNSIVNSFFKGIIQDSESNGQGESKAQQQAVS